MKMTQVASATCDSPSDPNAAPQRFSYALSTPRIHRDNTELRLGAVVVFP